MQQMPATRDKSNDDCYFYYYSTCTKGTDCPFRHCEAALGTETVCSLWKEGRCFRKVCKFRHMESRVNRSLIPCYWENQPSGCRKPHCVFLHHKPRTSLTEALQEKPPGYILPVSSQHQAVGSTPNSGATQPAAVAVDGAAAAEEQIRVDAGPPPIPSVTAVVEPVVVSFDEESDTESNTSTPVKPQQASSSVKNRARTTTTTKPRLKAPKMSGGDSNDMDIGVKSLEQIRLEKMHEQQHDFGNFNGNENVVVDLRCRLKLKRNWKDSSHGVGPVRKRVLLTLANNEDVSNVEGDSESKGEFRIKTLDEIKQEKKGKQGVNSEESNISVITKAVDNRSKNRIRPERRTLRRLNRSKVLQDALPADNGIRAQEHEDSSDAMSKVSEDANSRESMMIAPPVMETKPQDSLTQEDVPKPEGSDHPQNHDDDIKMENGEEAVASMTADQSVGDEKDSSGVDVPSKQGDDGAAKKAANVSLGGDDELEFLLPDGEAGDLDEPVEKDENELMEELDKMINS